MYISYLEIYNDDGYDLLRDDSTGKLEDLPKVVLREDEDGNIHLRNLSVNMASTKEDALNLLFMGDTNRVVAETAMNDASSRSHCLFIVWIDSTQAGSDVVRRSKLHLVDLAGSERVSKTGAEGQLLREATHINLSLHYLEQVIVALHDKTKGRSAHVPYRNSMMTSVLRDSLGGNCKTTMVGCVATEASNISESISTCRFAQRVAQIKNNARVNEELDPNLLIARLKREVSELKEEVKVARSGQDGEPEVLEADDVEKCKALVMQYVAKNVDPKEPFMCGSVERLRVCFRILRDMTNNVGDDGDGVGGPGGAGGGGGGGNAAHKAALEAEAQKLRLEIAQRDQEIGVLMQMLSKQKGGGDARPFISAAQPAGSDRGAPAASLIPEHPAFAQSAAAGGLPMQASAAVATAAAAPVAFNHHNEGGSAAAMAEAAAVAAPKAAAPAPAARPARRIPGEKPSVKLPPGVEAADLLLDKQKAFEAFRQLNPAPAALEENKGLLKEKITQAKGLGEEANAVRNGINGAKTRLEKLRTERALLAANSDDAASIPDGPEELNEVREIDRLKGIYRDRTTELRQVKSDIDQIQRLFEQHRLRQQKDFETWFASLRKTVSVDKLDEDKKRELYDRITGTGEAASGAPTPTAAAASPAAAAAPAASGTPANGAAASATTTGGMGMPPKPPGSSSGCPPAQPSAAAAAAAVASSPALPAQAQLSSLPPWARQGGAAAATPAAGPASPAVAAVAPRSNPTPVSTAAAPAAVAPAAVAPAAAVPAVAKAASAAASLPPGMSTGDAQTDDDISAYFAALGALAKS
eukprot:TRINITY_DN27648_c0_g1_i3.p1 TRINITY_DN27648_c0_g1~~TRINITY_DN27648_c0_g1_i3.p1  ORF type:complete len:811 (-),score=280.94 TRINITY_DN27648_c0_g1_i3:153-2585(-)